MSLKPLKQKRVYVEVKEYIGQRDRRAVFGKSHYQTIYGMSAEMVIERIRKTFQEREG